MNNLNTTKKQCDFFNASHKATINSFLTDASSRTRMYLPNNISMDVDHMLEKKKIKLLEQFMWPATTVLLQNPERTRVQ